MHTRYVYNSIPYYTKDFAIQKGIVGINGEWCYDTFSSHIQSKKKLSLIPTLESESKLTSCELFHSFVFF